MLATQAMIIALRLSLAVLAAQLLFLVVFDWRPQVPHVSALARISRWWRLTFATMGGGLLLSLSNSITALNHPTLATISTREWMLMCGLALMNVSVMSAHAGFLVARGANSLNLWFNLCVPVSFVLLTLWVLR